MTDPAGIGASTDLHRPGNACVIPAGWRWKGHCTCGHFNPKPHIFKGIAVTETHEHALNARCALERPLVVSRPRC